MVRTKQTRKKSSIVHRRIRQISLATSVKSTDSSSSSLTDDGVASYQDLVAMEWDSPEHLLQAYDKYCKEELEKLKSECNHDKRTIKLFRDKVEQELPRDLMDSRLLTEWDEQEFLKSLNDPNVQKGVYEGFRSENTAPFENRDFKKPQTPPKPSRSRASSRKLSASENLSSASKRSSSTSDRSRSTSRKPSANRKRSASQSAMDKFKTPLMSCKRMMTPGSFITPKVSNTPMTMMRRPQMGEVPFSMDGSPLMVNPIASEEYPTVNVPVQGRIFSIIPQPGAPHPDLADLDEQTKSYLKTLRDHLEILAPKSPPKSTRKKL